MEYISHERKLLPYGMMNFEDIRLDNYYYVDATFISGNILHATAAVIGTVSQLLRHQW